MSDEQPMGLGPAAKIARVSTGEKAVRPSGDAVEKERLEGLGKARGLTEIEFRCEQSARGQKVYHCEARRGSERRKRSASSMRGYEAALAALGSGIRS